MALISHFFPDMEDAEKLALLEKPLASRKTRVVKPRALADVLKDLKGSDDWKDFQRLHDQFMDEQRQALVLERFSVPRAQAEAQTPSVIKALRPKVELARGLPGVQLTYQVGTQSFQGYYPRDLSEEDIKKFRSGGKVKTRFSTSRTIGDKWTADTALVQVVNWLWNQHRKMGRDI